MGSPSEQIIIVNDKGERLSIEQVMELYKDDDNRVLANDEVGKTLYVGDLNLYYLKPLPDGNYLAQQLKELGLARFGLHLIRRQIGGVVVSVTEDTVFLVRNEDTIIKVRADKLKKGMVLASGEKVFS